VSAVLETLSGTAFLATVPREEIEHLVARSRRLRYGAGERIFGELEPRDTLIVILSGRVRILVAAGEPSEQVVGEAGPGTPLGEVGLLTGRVASATAVALEESETLHIPRDAVADLVVRYPDAARVFARLLAGRIREVDAALSRSLGADDAAAPPALAHAVAATRHGIVPTLVAAFRETILSHRTELPFIFLAGFVSSLVVARIAILLGDFSAPALRDAYVFGLLLLIATGACAHFVFHRTARRILCGAYGAALGFLVNELSVLLAFDVFFSDTRTEDKSLDRHAIEAYKELYQRAPSRYAFILVLAVAIQATYMRGFYRRAFFIIASRIRRRLSS